MTPSLQYAKSIWWLMHHSESYERCAFPLTCYVDDSAAAGVLAVVGGPLIPKRTYGSFHVGWDAVLERHKVKGPIHMREFGRPDGRLGYLTDDERKGLFSDLVQVINRNKVYSISASISEIDFRKWFHADKFKGLLGPASIAFGFCITTNHNMCKLYPNSGMDAIAYLVSESPEESQLTEMHRLTRRWQEREETSYIGAIAFDSHKNVYALQAADLVAWSNRRKLIGEPFNEGFNALERLTRNVMGYQRDYPHFHFPVREHASKLLSQIVNETFPVLPKIGMVKLLLDKEDMKVVEAALRQNAAQNARKKIKMKPSPTEAQEFDSALDKILSVSHDELKRREAEWKKQKAAKKQAKSKT